jgi:hypothetical protein
MRFAAAFILSTRLRDMNLSTQQQSISYKTHGEGARNTAGPNQISKEKPANGDSHGTA